MSMTSTCWKRAPAIARPHEVACTDKFDGGCLSCYFPQWSHKNNPTRGPMYGKHSHSRSRRRFLRGLGLAPALLGMPRFALSATAGGGADAAAAVDAVPQSADQVLNVADFEALAR